MVHARFLIPILSFAVFAVVQPLSAQDKTESTSLPPGFEPPTATDPRAAQIIAAHWKARGGQEAFQEVLRLRWEGTWREAGETWFCEREMDPEGRWRLERWRHRDGHDERKIFASDGQVAWTREKVARFEPPELMSADVQATFDAAHEREFCLLGYRAKGHHFGYRGTTRVRGRTAYLLQGRLASGADVFLSFDTETLLLTRLAFDKEVAGQPVHAETFVTRYERVGGAFLPSETETIVGGGNVFRKVEWTEFEVPRSDLAQRALMPKVPEFWLRQGDGVVTGSDDPR